MSWTAEEFEGLLAALRSNAGDLTDVEVKRALGGCPDLKETLSAFGNMPEGGTIVLGLDEASGFKASGIENPAKLEAAVASQARNSVRPPVQVDFERAKIDGKSIVIARVAGLPSSDKPCRTTGGNHAYLRQSDGDYRMSDQEVQQILAARQRPRYDVDPVDGTSMKNLDTAMLDHFVAAAKASSRRLAEAPDEDILRFKRILEPVGDRLTVAGIYALGNYPQQFAPHLSITAVVEPAIRGGLRNLDRMTFDGPLPEMLDRAIDWVQRNTRTAIRIGSDGHGRDETEIPMVAIRELIANALVHRDLGPHTSGQDVHIRLTSDQLVITSPGGLWGLSQARLGDPGARSAVNEFLYDICMLTRTPSAHRVIEGEGGGLHDVGLALREAGMHRPIFHDYGVRFTTLIPRPLPLPSQDEKWFLNATAQSRVSELQKQILVSMRHGVAWNSATVQETFGPFRDSEAEAVLQELVSSGLARKDVDTAYGSYVIHERLADPDSTRSPEIITIDSARAGRPEATEALVLPRTNHDATQQLPNALPQSKNARSIWNAMGSSPLSVADLEQATGLTAHRIRYALRPMLASGAVERFGGQGYRSTTYRRTDTPDGYE